LPKDGPIQTINDLFPFNGMPGALAPTREVSGYRGPLSGFLNQELPKYDTDWEVHGQVIYVGKEIIRAYPVVDMPSNTTLSAGLNNNGSSTVAGGYTGTGSTSAASNSLGQSATGSTTTGQSSSTTTNIDSWKELLSTLAAYTGDSKKVYAEPSNGRVTIRCSRYCQGEVVRYIREHNRTAGRTVLLTVAILTTQKKGSDDYGFNPKLIYQNLPTGYTFSILGQTAATDTSLGGAISGGVLNPPAGSMAAKFNGTTLAVQAISQDEEVTGKLQKFGFVSNNRPFSVRNALDYGYVQSIVTAVGSTLSSTGAQIATDVIGDQLQILPRIQADGFIRLQLALSRTSIQSITQVTMGSTQTTIPQVLDNSSSPQEFTIRDGATLIVSDISTDTSDRVRSGAGSVYNWLLGGYANTSNEKDKAIIIVTAREWHPGDEGLGVVGGVVP